MPSLAAHVGAVNRDKIVQLEQRWKLSNAETLRRLIILGLGGTILEADTLNRDMARKRAAAEAHYNRPREPSVNEKARMQLGAAAPPRKPMVKVRLPKLFCQHVEAQGGLRTVIERGLRVLEGNSNITY